MKQVIQNYKTGDLALAEVPIPAASSNKVLIKNQASLISIGTEKAIIELGQKSLIGKAKARPDLVKRVIEKAKREGILKTFHEAMGRLDEPKALGYSSAGVVVEAGKNVNSFSPGDRVAAMGAGYAGHAEYVSVPENLSARIPDNVSYEEASFGTLGGIALHGIRQTKVTFGERIAVIGLGLIGQLAVQILKSYGAVVYGMDVDPNKVRLAKELGADDAFASADALKEGIERATGGVGVDAVLITASTTSDEPVNTAVDIARYAGKVVIVGVADIHPNRNEVWAKEVEITVSKAGGPGLFDNFYENQGIDYPIGYVRWTEKRNLEEFLRLVSEGKVKLAPLISHRFSIMDAEQVYADMLKGEGGPYVGVILEYPEHDADIASGRTVENPDSRKRTDKVSVGVIGAGIFGKALFLPALRKLSGVRLHTLSTSSSANVYHTGKKYGFENLTTDYQEVLLNQEINTVMILTPHRLHARMVIDALKAGKNVFVEKPLAVSEEELREVEKTYENLAEKPVLMVGYNRRHSPLAKKLKDFFAGRKDPMVVHYRANVGYVPPEHWVHSPEEGGSRIVGESGHFIDFMQYLTGASPVRVYAERISGNNKTALNSDNVAVTIKFSDGSVGNMLYTASGDRAYSREHVEVYAEGKTGVLTDFKELELYAKGKKNIEKSWNQELGHQEELENLRAAIEGKAELAITPGEIFASTLATFRINDALEKGVPQDV
jgi:predicted dehydrogenase